ncbi:hypothetical protein niasHT_021415 [Heterodera trifolii]|uniref:rhomboid protease n=1 Tax=Heterodera trifolii TaxID=157864 RepID=A0ABD2K6Q2_9BILA
MLSARSLHFALSRLSSFAPLCRASTSSVRHFCLLGRNLTRYRAKEPLRDQLQNALTKNIEAKAAPRADSIPPRPLRQVIIRGGLFFFVASNVFSMIAAVNDFEMTQKRFQSVIDQAIYEFRRTFSFTPPQERKTEAAKLIWTIIGANVAIFLLWRVPTLVPLLWQYFSSGVASKSLCMPMLFSVFSHQNLMHLFFNMYVLNSFAIGAITLLGSSQFLAMYLSGGLFSSWVSLCQKAVMRSTMPSLGASGAICAVVGYICAKLPDTRVHIIFLPMFTFSAEYALYGLIAFELLCMFRILPIHRFIPLDNSAHVAGLLFGMYYANYGEQNYRSKSVNVSMSSSMVGQDGLWRKTALFTNRPKEERQREQDDDALRVMREKERRKEMRRKFTQENQAQQKRQKDIEKRHNEWTKQMEEEREAVKERIRVNKQKLEERKKSGMKGEGDDDGEEN